MPLQLSDGTAVRLVAVNDGNRDRFRRELVQGFAQLSERSRASRFLSGTPRLNAAQLRQLVDGVDGVDHVAMALELVPEAIPIGLGRFIRDPGAPDSAEVAITVLDDWQRKGAGTVVLAALAQAARERGIRRFSALVQSENRAPLAMMRHAGAVSRFDRGGGVADILVELP